MYMSEMIKERQNSEKVERHDLFSNLLEANNGDMDAIKLTESELIGVSWFFPRWLELEIHVIYRKHLHLFNCGTRGISACRVHKTIINWTWNQTTAHTLGFTFALLALYPDEQERLYQHILSILPDGRIPVCLKFIAYNVNTFLISLQDVWRNALV